MLRIMATRALDRVTHPHVWRRPGVCGGEPVIRGTRFPVRSVVEYVLHDGMTPEEMVRSWPHLSLAKVYDSIAYYYDHKTAIDRDIRAEKRAFERLTKER